MWGTTRKGRPYRDRVHVHDLHATILHLLGLDHELLTYRYARRDFHLTDVIPAYCIARHTSKSWSTYPWTSVKRKSRPW